MWRHEAQQKMIEQAFAREVEEVLGFFDVDLDRGLSTEQVTQVGRSVVRHAVSLAAAL